MLHLRVSLLQVKSLSCNNREGSKLQILSLFQIWITNSHLLSPWMKCWWDVQQNDSFVETYQEETKCYEVLNTELLEQKGKQIWTLSLLGLEAPNQIITNEFRPPKLRKSMYSDWIIHPQAQIKVIENFLNHKPTLTKSSMDEKQLVNQQRILFQLQIKIIGIGRSIKLVATINFNEMNHKSA